MHWEARKFNKIINVDIGLFVDHAVLDNNHSKYKTTTTTKYSLNVKGINAKYFFFKKNESNTFFLQFSENECTVAFITKEGAKKDECKQNIVLYL